MPTVFITLMASNANARLTWLILDLRMQFLAAPFASTLRQASTVARQVYQQRACSILSALANERAVALPPSRDGDPGDALQAPSHTGTNWIPLDYLLSQIYVKFLSSYLFQIPFVLLRVQ